MRHQKVQLGSIVSIPLQDGRFAFAKVFNDFELGVFEIVADHVLPIETVLRAPIVFYQAASDRPIKEGTWAVLGVDAFESDEAAWAPAKAMGVVPGLRINPGTLQITHRGQIRRANLDEVRGMEAASFCQSAEQMVEVIVDRLIYKRDDQYRVR
jgi:hypothetical protein